MQTGLYAIGKLKEKHWRDACDEYAKRLPKSFEFREFKEEKLPQNPSEAEIRIALEKEAAVVLEKLPQPCTLVLLTKEGKTYDSEAFAVQLARWKSAGQPVVFFIGSSYGIGEALRKEAQQTLSFSQFTFPHQLMRVIFFEQLYRAESILAGTKYHK